jgi:hypothetical protein
VGAFNHAYFMYFLVSVCGGSIAIFHIFSTYLSVESPRLSVVETSSCILTSRLCEYYAFDGWTVSVIIWTSLAGFMVFFLLLTHIYLICVNLTTNEMSNFWRYSYLVLDGDVTKPTYEREFFNPFDNGPISNFYRFFSESKFYYLNLFNSSKLGKELV